MKIGAHDRQKKEKYRRKNLEKEKTGVGNKLACGVSIGAINAFFGGGGGMLAVPLLERSGYAQKCAHATAILVILPVSALSFLWYVFRGLYDLSLLIPVSVGVSVGGALGAKWLGKLSEKWVEITFAILQFVAGVSLLFMRGG